MRGIKEAIVVWLHIPKHQRSVQDLHQIAALLGWDPCGLNENGLHRFIYLHTWSPISGTVWEGIDVSLLEEICHCGWVLRFQYSKSWPFLLELTNQM